MQHAPGTSEMTLCSACHTRDLFHFTLRPRAAAVVSTPTFQEWTPRFGVGAPLSAHTGDERQNADITQCCSGFQSTEYMLLTSLLKGPSAPTWSVTRSCKWCLDLSGQLVLPTPLLPGTVLMQMHGLLSSSPFCKWVLSAFIH